jgi:hypothetical protein
VTAPAVVAVVVAAVAVEAAVVAAGTAVDGANVVVAIGIAGTADVAELEAVADNTFPAQDSHPDAN